MHLPIPIRKIKQRRIIRPSQRRLCSSQRERGFTLIELMIVVSIVGILAAIAIPAYMDYIVRVQVSEGINLSGSAKAAIAAYYQEHGTYPTDNDEAALPPAATIKGDYVSSISIDGAVVSISFNNEANSQIAGQTMTLAATSLAGSLTWNCASSGLIKEKHLPRSCN